MPAAGILRCSAVAFGLSLSAGMFVSEAAQAQDGGFWRNGVFYSRDGHYQDHRGNSSPNRPPRWVPARPSGQGSHYQDHRGDRPPGPRSPGYQNPYLPGSTATPPRGPTVNSSGQHSGARVGPAMGGGGGHSSGRR